MDKIAWGKFAHYHYDETDLDQRWALTIIRINVCFRPHPVVQRQRLQWLLLPKPATRSAILRQDGHNTDRFFDAP